MTDEGQPDAAASAIGVDSCLGPYRLVRRVGEGGMGAVWEACHRETGERVAVKVLREDYADDPDTHARFLREGRAAARVSHPHAVELLDSGSDGDVAYLAFEFLEGETLADRLAREGALPHAAVCGVMVPVLAAVAAAHRAGVVHRDLKPSNLFLTQVDGAQHPKVLDFGISKLQRHADVSTLTETGTTLGTPAYMAPEQLRSARDATALSDVFSLGVVLYECSTGRRPFAGETSVALFEAILSGRFTPPKELAPGLPPRFDAAVRRALRPHPEDRFALVDALARELLADAPPAMRARWAGAFPTDGAASAAPIDAQANTLPAIPAATLSSRRPTTGRATLTLLGAVAAAGVVAWSLIPGRAPSSDPSATPVMPAALVAPVERERPSPPAVAAAPVAEAPVAAAVVEVVDADAAVSGRSRSSHASRARGSRDAGPSAAPAALPAAPSDAGAPPAHLPVGTNLMPF